MVPEVQTSYPTPLLVRMTVNHSKDEYVRGEASANTVEVVFSVFKRGMKGVYQQCSGNHLHRYVAEFAFRYKQPHRP